MSETEQQRRPQNLQYTLLAGEAARYNPVPGATAHPSRAPFVTFQNRFNETEFFGVSKDDLSRHWLLLGSPGGGKTTLSCHFLEKLLAGQRDDEIILIYDTKGDYLETFAPSLGNHSVFVIGTAPEYRRITCRWNLFAEAMERDSQGRLHYLGEQSDLIAKEIANAFYTNRQSQNQPFFHLAAADITAKVIIYLMREAERTGDKSRLNNTYLGNFLKSADRQKLLSLLGDARYPDFHGCKDYISGNAAKTTAQAESVLSYIHGMANDLFIGIFGGSPCPAGEDNPEISMKDLFRLRQSPVVFIEYDLTLGSVLAPVYTILFDLLLRLSLGGRQDRRRQIFLILDELARLEKLERLESAVSYGRSQGLHIIAGIQAVGQILEIYGEHLGQAILSNFMNMAAFYLSDYESRDFVRRRLGENYCQYSFLSQNTRMNCDRQGYCLEDWEMIRLRKAGQAAVQLASEPPFLFWFPPFRPQAAGTAPGMGRSTAV